MAGATRTGGTTAKSGGAGEVRFKDAVAARIRQEGSEFDVESNLLLFTLSRAANLLAADLDSTIWRPFGVTYAGFRVIFVIWAVGPLEPRSIAQFASVSRASISSVINTLERDGYVERKRESADRRLVTVQLTDKGRELWMGSFRKHNARETQWASSLTRKERVTLASLLERLIHDRPRTPDVE